MYERFDIKHFFVHEKKSISLTENELMKENEILEERSLIPSSSSVFDVGE